MKLYINMKNKIIIEDSENGVFLINKEDLHMFFPWLKLCLEEEPKKRRKPNPHRKTDNNFFKSKAAE
jgi:hypothetical protein